MDALVHVLLGILSKTIKSCPCSSRSHNFLIAQSITNVKTAFVHSLCYLYRPLCNREGAPLFNPIDGACNIGFRSA